jgi:uncharacterized membrane protein YidH (DUF202 family)
MSTRDSRDQKTRDSRQPHSERNLIGLIIIIVGGVLLARQLGVELPYWLFTWPMILIGLGFLIGAKHSFRNPKWLIPVAIGGYFLMTQFLQYEFDIARYIGPLLIIAVGLVLLLNSKKKWLTNSSTFSHADRPFDSSEDSLDSVTIFGGVKKNIISKNFRGGEAVTVFGGTELNFMHADGDLPIVLELTQVFGGTKLIVPPHWKIQTDEMVTIFGGLNDKRPLPPQPMQELSKVIIIRGTCIFAGIDIKSY